MKRAAAISAMFFIAIVMLGAQRPNGLADVVEVRHWSYSDYTRVVVETTKAVKVKTSVKHLAADSRAKRPERLYVDLGGLWVGRRYLDGIELGDGLLQGIRLGQNTLHTTRLVLDLEHYERHRLFTLEHPNRVVIDVYGHRRSSTRTVPEAGPPVGQRPTHIVVIDPGHGGRDPGAIGIGGAQEKDITLKIAKALGAKLTKRGFDVRYTRRDDRTVSLEERTAIAEAARADLFVSIHTNSASRRSLNGIETYYLDENNERHSLTVAARENGITRDQVDDLQRTLARLRVSEISTHSQRLANLVQTELVSGLPSRYRVNDLGVKKGPFYVLFLSETPAILVEAGFLTNRVEARRLRDEGYIDALASQMAVGLARYRDGAATMARRGAF
jgi:N-acetylmuramoyl-L-alanine amidase